MGWAKDSVGLGWGKLTWGHELVFVEQATFGERDVCAFGEFVAGAQVALEIHVQRLLDVGYVHVVFLFFSGCGSG